MATHKNPYTLQALPAGDTRFIARRPGVIEIERLFPSPVATGKGNIAIEGGLSVVAGPGMGTTRLFAQLATQLSQDRGLATALVSFPDIDRYQEQDGFYGFLGDLVQRIRTALLNAESLQKEDFSAVVTAVRADPPWDGSAPQTMTTRGFERFIANIAAGSIHTPGLCLFFDDVDQVTRVPWKGPLISALRFVFQASVGITPVYGLWTLFGDESLPGSNYFRNVTRPFFLEPLAGPGADVNERDAFITLGLPDLKAITRQSLARLVGGHPLLLHRVLADYTDVLTTPEKQAALTPDDLDKVLGKDKVAAQRAFVTALIERTPGLGAALLELAHKPIDWSTLPKGLLASGFIDLSDSGQAVLPHRIAQAIS